MEACRVGKTEMVELLINHGADPNTVNDVSLNANPLQLLSSINWRGYIIFAGRLDCINGGIKPW